MASILRSCKFIRFFAGFARNFAFGGRNDAIEGSPLLSNVPVLSTNYTIRSLATEAANRHDSSLERSLRRLDQDVRKSGRISRRELDDVLEEIRQTRSATSAQSLMVIRCCGNLVPEELPEVRTKLVQEIWKTLETLGVPMDISHYNALLRVYLENEHQFSPSEFLTELERKGVEPNRVTYQRLVSRHCLQGDMDGAAKILQIMRDQQLPVNENVFNALVTGHAQAGDMESARGILGVMKQAGLDPGAETYTALLNGHAKSGDIEAIRAVISECQTKEVELMDRDLLSVIHTLATTGHVNLIEELVGFLKKEAGYNQDCVNLILRLVNAGQEDVGLQLLGTMIKPLRPSSDEQAPSGSFFVRQLIKANRPVEKVVEVCKKMQEAGIHPGAFMVALETALNLGKHEISLKLTSALKEQGVSMRQHYFWPLLASHSKDKNSQGICEVLRHMQTLGMTPLGETLREYAVTGLVGSPENQVSQLRSAGVSSGAAVNAVVQNLLANGKLKAAADIASQFRANYPVHIFRRPLVLAFHNTRDVTSMLQILKLIVNSLPESKDFEEEPGESESRKEYANNSNEIVGKIIYECISKLQKDVANITQAILEGLVAQGQGLVENAAEQIQEKLGANLTPEISTLLSKLTSGTLVPKAGSDAPNYNPLEGEDLENMLITLEAKGQPVRGVKSQLLRHYCKIKDLEKAEKIKEDLLADGFVFGSGSLAMLIDLYSHHEKLEEALAVKNTLAEREPEFKLDSMKLVKLVSLLVKNERVKEAVELIKTSSSNVSADRNEDRVAFNLKSQCWRLLNSMAENGNVDDLQAVFEALISNGLIQVSNVLLGPLIKVHLLKDDLKGALARFEWCSQQYKATPWKNELACRLIQAEDAVSLQRLTDLSTQVHGEVNSLYDLVLAFVECGRVRQARKILETPGLRSRPQRLSAACQRYSEEGKVTTLEGLVEATKDMGHIDRGNIYLHLLKSYCKAKDTEKALGLWTRSQEEDVQPSDEFLWTLGTYLEKEGQSVPFEIPSAPAVATSVTSEKEDKTSPKKETSNTLAKAVTPVDSSEMQLFRQALRRKDVDKALDLKQLLHDGGKPLTVRDSSVLVETLVNSNRVGEASKLVLEMLENGIHPLPRIFRFLLNKLALTGDLDTLNNIGKHLDDERKKIVSFDNRVCNAHIKAGKAKEYLDGLEKQLNAATTEAELAALGASFPRGGAIGILENHPELVPQFAELASKFASRGEISPTNVLWMQYFVQGEREAANKLWETHLSSLPRLMFQWICQMSRKNNDKQLAADLFSLLASSPGATDGAKGNVFSCLLDVLTSQNLFDEGLAALQAADKDVSLENVNRTALMRLKTGLEEQGKTFPFSIPAKSTTKASSSSSSSSSSDDDETKKIQK